MRIAVAGLLVLSLALPLTLLARKSTTLDEVSHVPAGYSYLRTGEIVLNPMHPPLVKEIGALPLLFLGPPMPEDAVTIRRLGRDITYQWEFGRRFLAGEGGHALLVTARAAVVFLSVALAGTIFLWARELWGPAGGLASLFLYVFDPTITAHAQLVTTDVGFAFFATLFVFLLRRWVLEPSPGRLFAAGVALGLASGAKFSAVALAPITLLLAALAIVRAPVEERRSRARVLVPGVLLLPVIAFPVLWAIYLFPSDLTFYARGLAAVQADYNPGYLHFLMGDFRTGRWPHYFLVAWLVKTPIPALLTSLLAAWLFLRGRRAAWLDEAFVLVPGLVLFAGYSLGADPLGIRYVIPCYPFLFVFCGRAGSWLASLGPKGAALAGALALWYLAEFVAVAPDHLSYFNQIAGGPEGGLDWLDDSNVDWGQGLIQLRSYLQEHDVGRYRLCIQPGLDPRSYGLDGNFVWIDEILAPPPPGVLVMSAHCLARARAWLTRRHGDGAANWLARAKSTAVVGHAYYVYEIPPDHRAGRER